MKPTLTRTNYTSLYGHRDQLLDISHIQEAINHPVASGMAQHVVYFWGTRLKVRRQSTGVSGLIL